MDHEGIRLSQCTYTHVHAHVLLAHTRTLAILINTHENCCIDNSKVCERINCVCVRVLCLISCAQSCSYVCMCACVHLCVMVCMCGWVYLCVCVCACVFLVSGNIYRNGKGSKHVWVERVCYAKKMLACLLHVCMHVSNHAHTQLSLHMYLYFCTLSCVVMSVLRLLVS